MDAGKRTTGAWRVVYVGLALATIAVGLLVHFGGGALAPAVRDVVADALWAAMIVWWISAIWPAMGRRFLMAYAVCVLVELSQLVHTPWLDAVRATRLGHLVLGSGFEARDLLAYAAGVAAAAFADARFRAAAARPRPGP
jgi:hypothetical protein